MSVASSFRAVAPITKPTLNLLELHPDVLQKILRHVPLQDKICVLRKMPEFRELLEHRASFLEYLLPFSFEYLNYVSLLRTGWYALRKNWGHRFFMQIDETTLQISIRHFHVEKLTSSYAPNSCASRTCNTIAETTQLMNNFLDKYQWMDDMQLLTYHFEGYGLIMVDYSFHFKVHNMRFFDRTQHTIEENVTYFVHSQWPFSQHFSLLLKPNKTLVVQCILAAVIRCRCQTRIQKLTPFTYDVSEDCRFLTRPEGEPIPFIAYQKFSLDNSEERVTCETLYHANYKLEYTFPIVQSMRSDPILKRLLSEGNPFYTCKKKCKK